ncbi:hypothetical protein NQ315_003925 [Exocentrus adspersus]|uniref:Helix-turn-helix domain-containing protein n=1 Tax=Exocentrus adspersus TaxID=1586481 RepID=A0AAV8VZL6_9CUCU|nr:hypothetical protein NQ315_003925 [Exocentrus adspersus]
MSPLFGHILLSLLFQFSSDGICVSWAISTVLDVLIIRRFGRYSPAVFSGVLNFQLDNEFYQEEFGVVMGSPLSSNIFMKDFEKRAVDSYHLKPSMWVRYVNDTFIVWSHGRDTIEGFLQHLNSIEESIKLKMETEKDGKLAFLDVLVEKKKTNDTPRTTVYNLHFDSNHHTQTKIGVAKCLYDRAKTVCLHDSRSRRGMHQHHANPQEQRIPTEDTSQNPFSKKSTREQENQRRY